jgi:hypothetical protein
VQRLAATDPRSDLFDAQLELTATAMRFVYFSHSLPDPEAVDAQFPDRRRRKCTSNSGSLTSVFGSCFFPQFCRNRRHKIYNNIATPALTRSTEHTTSIALFLQRLLTFCATLDVTIGWKREWQDKGRALTRTHVRGSARKNVAPGAVQTAPDS